MILLNASRQATDSEDDLRSKASAPPDVPCLRFGGLLIPDYASALERQDTGNLMTLWRCVNCGNRLDLDILANQRKHSQPARLRTRHARPPIGPSRIPAAGFS